MALHKGLRIAVVLGIFVAALSGIHRPAFAACTSPAGIGGTITWNGTDSVIWCDGTNWFALKNSAGAAGSTGILQASNGSGGFVASNLYWDSANYRVGFVTTSPSYSLSFGGEGSRSIGVERESNDAGRDLSVIAGGAPAASTDLNGGNLFLSSGTATGTGSSNMYFRTATAGATATTDRTPTDKMTILGNGRVGIGTTTPAFKLHLSEAGYLGLALTRGSGGSYVMDITNDYGLPTGSLNVVSNDATNGNIGFRAANSGNAQVVLLASGNVGVGTATPAYKLHIEDNAANTSGSDWRVGSYANQKINPLATSSSTFSALEAVAMVEGSSDITTAYGGRGGLQTNGTNTITNALGWAGLTYVPTASTITNAYGTKGEVRTNHASASVTNAYAGSFAVTKTLGTITNGMGVYIGTIQGTNKWGLYSSDSTANNYFAGNVGIGTTTPGSKLQIVSTDTAATSGSVMGSVQTQMTVTPAADSSADYTGGIDRITLSGVQNVTGSIRASYGVATHSGSGTLETAYGSIGIADNASSGTITKARGAYNYSRANSAGPVTSGIGTISEAMTNHASATITTGYGAYNMAQTTLGTMTTGYGSFDTVRANAPTTMTVAQATRANIVTASGSTITTAYGLFSDLTNGGTVANWYGLYIPAVSGTAPTTSRYPVYVADTGNNYFAGNIGIGTTAPRSLLDVQGDGGAYGPIYWSGGSGGSILGEYGAAITSVAALSARHGVGLQIDSVDAAGSGYAGIGQIISRVASTGGGSPSGLIVTDISNTATARTGTVTGVYVTNITGNSGNNGGGPSNASGLAVGAVTFAGADVNGYANGLWIGNTITNSTTAANIFAINSQSTAKSYFAGNVGIGTTAPLNPLHVVGSMRVERSGTPNQYLEVSLGGASSNQLNFNSIEASKKNFVLSSLHGGTGSAAGALDFVFMTGLNSAPTEVMRIKENGNVGMGTSSPAAKLDVNGFMRLAKNGSAPATCDATIDGAIALTSARRMCVCDATSWKEVNSATACTW